MGKSRWNDSLIAVLAETYPVETTAYTAALLGMSETAVKNKAKKLGIVKVAKSRWMERAEHIRSHFQDKSFSEMAKELGISKMSVSRIAAKLGLKRTKEEIYRVSSRVRGEMIRRERRRVIFGLSPATRIKVVSNRARVRLRSRLKGIGYVVGQERNILYYTGNVERKERLECRGVKLGLRFLPFPGNELSVFIHYHITNNHAIRTNSIYSVYRLPSLLCGTDCDGHTESQGSAAGGTGQSYRGRDRHIG